MNQEFRVEMLNITDQAQGRMKTQIELQVEKVREELNNQWKDLRQENQDIIHQQCEDVKADLKTS